MWQFRFWLIAASVEVVITFVSFVFFFLRMLIVSPAFFPIFPIFFFHIQSPVFVNTSDCLEKNLVYGTFGQIKQNKTSLSSFSVTMYSFQI